MSNEEFHHVKFTNFYMVLPRLSSSKFVCRCAGCCGVSMFYYPCLDALCRWQRRAVRWMTEPHGLRDSSTPAMSKTLGNFALHVGDRQLLAHCMALICAPPTLCGKHG